MITLEDVFSGPKYAGIEQASPLQRAICRWVECRPLGDLLSDEERERHFGTAAAPDVVPTLIVLVCGIRSGKSFLVACAAIWGALTVRCDKLKPYELPRFAIVAPRMDVAQATFKILRGVVESSPVLRRLLDGEPTSDTLVIRRPDGYRVELCCVAASAGGVTIRNRWLAGFVFEEGASFGTEATGNAVTLEELYRAAQTRLLPGARGWIIGSPMGPQGLFWELYEQHFGKPGRTFVAHAPTRAMVPSFPQSTIDAIAAEDPDAARREYGAEWLDPESQLYESELLDDATRKGPPDQHHAQRYVAQDPATRGNGWTLATAYAVDVDGEPRVVVDLVHEWRGSKTSPLSPKAVFSEMAILLPNGVTEVVSDGWSIDALDDRARDFGLTLRQAKNHGLDMSDAYQRFHRLLRDRRLELPDHPTVRRDLMGVRKKVTGGGIRYELARTPDGRHCDFAPSVVLAVALADMHAASGCSAALGGTRRSQGLAGPRHRHADPARMEDYLKNRAERKLAVLTNHQPASGTSARRRR